MLNKGNIATNEERFALHETECIARINKQEGRVCKAICCACQNGLGRFAMKRFVLAAVLLAVCAAVFAYNPPYGGEEPFRLTNPEMMMGAASASGGPAFTVLPSSITYNPAIPAGQQHVTLDLSGTLLFNVDKAYSTDAKNGLGFQAGMIVPTEKVVLSFTMNYLNADFYGMNLDSTFIMHGGASKELNEKFSVGANAYIGFGSCFSIGTDAGVLFKLDDMERLKNPRLGLSLLNLGISSSDSTVVGIDGSGADYYPSPLTSRASFGATFFEKDSWTGAFSVDASIPFFQNFITDAAVAFCYNNSVTLSAAMQFNIREIAEGGADGLSWFSIGITFKNFERIKQKIAGTNPILQQSDYTGSFATQCLYSGILAVSGGFRIDSQDIKAKE